MTFEEWYVATKSTRATMVTAVGEEALRRDFEACWDTSRSQATFEANSKLGDAGNEAEKVQRRDAAVSEICNRWIRAEPPIKDLRAIIAKAQG